MDSALQPSLFSSCWEGQTAQKFGCGSSNKAFQGGCDLDLHGGAEAIGEAMAEQGVEP